MNPNEIEFVGEEHLVYIIPSFSFGEINLLCGTFGPFQGGMRVQIPLWLALQLKQQQKCRIVAPEWMNLEILKMMIEEEKLNPLCTKPPSEHFIDEAHMILNAASDDIPDVDAIRITVKDLWDIRASKLRSTINKFVKSTETTCLLNNVTLMEFNNFRPMLPHALDQMSRIAVGFSGNHDARMTQQNPSQHL